MAASKPVDGRPVRTPDRRIGRFQGFPAPPQKVIKPADQSAEQLIKLGLPPMPDQRAHPSIRRLWDKLLGRPIEIIPFIAEKALSIRTTFALSFGAYKQIAAGSSYENSRNWSGAYISADRDRCFSTIAGFWTVPTVHAVPFSADPQNVPFGTDPQNTPGIDWKCSNWIGLDGQRRYFNSSLPQIGTTSVLDAAGNPTPLAWTQWWARGTLKPCYTPLTNFELHPGDRIACFMTVVDLQHVNCFMINFNWPIPKLMPYSIASPDVILPDGSTAKPDIAGATAEWIVERPQLPDSTGLANFPNYGRSGFHDCLAVQGDQPLPSWFVGEPRDLKGARLIRMFEARANRTRTRYLSLPQRKLTDSSFVTHFGDFNFQDGVV